MVLHSNLVIFLFVWLIANGLFVSYEEDYGYSSSGLYAVDIECDEDAYNFSNCSYSLNDSCSGTPLVIMCFDGMRYNGYGLLSGVLVVLVGTIVQFTSWFTCNLGRLWPIVCSCAGCLWFNGPCWFFCSVCILNYYCFSLSEWCSAAL